MSCIRPIAPFGEIARRSPWLSERKTARIQATGIPKRCAASVTKALNGSVAACTRVAAICACAGGAGAMSEITPTTISSATRAHARLPLRRKRAIVLAAVKGKARAPAKGRP
jgi:hypothetical protein